MFGHRSKKTSDSARTPGKPWNDSAYGHGSENEESYKYVKSKDFPQKEGDSRGKSKDNPKNYEGKEHVKYREPGFTRHNIRIPEDEPHMKSRVTREEMHEMEDNFHMSVPDQTKYELEKKLKRARMKMDAPDQEEPDELEGNLVREVNKGIKDTTGKEEMGPNDMQSSMSKEHRKKMIVAIARRKMKKE